MEYEIIISTAAENDTEESYIFYEKKQPGLGERFLNELAENYNKLKLHPTHYSFVSAEKITRALSLKKFPFKIIFKLMGWKFMFSQFIIFVNGHPIFKEILNVFAKKKPYPSHNSRHPWISCRNHFNTKRFHRTIIHRRR